MLNQIQDSELSSVLASSLVFVCLLPSMSFGGLRLQFVSLQRSGHLRSLAFKQWPVVLCGAKGGHG
jgi:hypothetical protein